MTDEEKEAVYRTYEFCVAMSIGEPQRQELCQMVDRAPHGVPLPLMFSLIEFRKRITA